MKCECTTPKTNYCCDNAVRFWGIQNIVIISTIFEYVKYKFVFFYFILFGEFHSVAYVIWAYLFFFLYTKNFPYYCEMSLATQLWRICKPSVWYMPFDKFCNLYTVVELYTSWTMTLVTNNSFRKTQKHLLEERYYHKKLLF